MLSKLDKNLRRINIKNCNAQYSSRGKIYRGKAFCSQLCFFFHEYRWGFTLDATAFRICMQLEEH